MNVEVQNVRRRITAMNVEVQNVRRQRNAEDPLERLALKELLV